MERPRQKKTLGNWTRTLKASTPSPERPAARRILLAAAAVVTMLLVAFLCWKGAGGTDSNAAKKNAPPASGSVGSKPNAATRSRLIEAEVDPEAELVLSTRDNTATEWRKAFALMDKLTVRENAIIKPKPPADPPATEAEISALLKKIAPIIALLREGASKPDCDLGIRYLSFDSPFPHFPKAHALAVIARFDTAHVFTQSLPRLPLISRRWHAWGTAWIKRSSEGSLIWGYTRTSPRF